MPAVRGMFHEHLQAESFLTLCNCMQDCNLALLNGSNQIIFQSGTANQGTGACQLAVSGAGGGGFAVMDSTGATLYSQGAYSPPGTVPGTLPATQSSHRSA